MFSVAAEELTRRFGSFVAVNHLSLEINEGEVFGLLGPNGADRRIRTSQPNHILRRRKNVQTRRNLGQTSIKIHSYIQEHKHQTVKLQQKHAE